MVYLVS